MTWAEFGLPLGPVGSLIFFCVVLLIIYGVGIWIGTLIEKSEQADRDRKEREKNKVKRLGGQMANEWKPDRKGRR